MLPSFTYRIGASPRADACVHNCAVEQLDRAARRKVESGKSGR
jgi:hypothetical protein